MKKWVLIFLATASTYAFAKDIEKIKFEETRIYTPIKGSIATAGYALIKNESAKDMELMITEASPFKAVETHQTIEKDGHMAMIKVDKYIIKAKSQLELKPGGDHIMLFEPSREIKDNETLNLKFSVNGIIMSIPFKTVPRLKK